MQSQKSGLADFIYELVEQLLLSTEFNADEIERHLADYRAELAGMRDHYEGPAPEGAAAVRELMLESLTLFHNSLTELSSFLDDQDEDRLSRALRQSEEANDLLSAIEEVVSHNKMVLSEMVDA